MITVCLTDKAKLSISPSKITSSYFIHIKIKFINLSAAVDNFSILVTKQNANCACEVHACEVHVIN